MKSRPIWPGNPLICSKIMRAMALGASPHGGGLDWTQRLIWAEDVSWCGSNQADAVIGEKMSKEQNNPLAALDRPPFLIGGGMLAIFAWAMGWIGYEYVFICVIVAAIGLFRHYVKG